MAKELHAAAIAIVTWIFVFYLISAIVSMVIPVMDWTARSTAFSVGYLIAGAVLIIFSIFGSKNKIISNGFLVGGLLVLVSAAFSSYNIPFLPVIIAGALLVILIYFASKKSK